MLLCVIYTVQSLVGTFYVRFLVENAGSMHKIHLEAFCKLLNLPLKKTNDFLWDPAQLGYAITRCRNFFRNYEDTEKIESPPLVFNHRFGPLVNAKGQTLPLAPLLRVNFLLGWPNIQGLSFREGNPLYKITPILGK